MLNGYLYIAWSDGTFDRRTFDGTTYGTPEAVNTGSQLTNMTDWVSDIQTMTGLFYDSGRIYFTKSGSSTLYYRYFTPESKVVGAQRLTASANVTGIDFSQVRGMFVAGDNLYWSTPSNDLRKIGWAQGAQSGRPVAGVATVVSSPTVDAYNWGSPRALFLFQDKDGDGPSTAPTAAYTQSCTSLSCTFDSSTSTAGTGTITGRSWNFGDGTTSTDANPAHAFSATGTYQVALTVTSSKGLTNTVTKAVQVTRVNQNPTADFTVACNQLTCTFDAAGSKDADGTVASYQWAFGDGTTGTGSPVDHPYATAGTRDVTLTVTDNEGGTATVTKSVKATQAGASFVAATSSAGNRCAHSVQIPSGVQAGDALLLFLTTNSSTATVTAPAGWTQVQTATADGLLGTVWSRTATAGDAGSTVTVPTSAIGEVRHHRGGVPSHRREHALGRDQRPGDQRVGGQPADDPAGQRDRPVVVAGQLLGREVLGHGGVHHPERPAGTGGLGRHRLRLDQRRAHRLRPAGGDRHPRRYHRGRRHLYLEGGHVLGGPGRSVV